MYVILLGENDLILGTLKDILSVCEGIVWEVDSQLTQVSLRITFDKRVSCYVIWSDLDAILCNATIWVYVDL